MQNLRQFLKFLDCPKLGYEVNQLNEIFEQSRFETLDQ